MNERAQSSDAELEASRWIARLEAENVTLSDHKRFRRWLAAAPSNRGAYEAVSRTWDKLDALRFLEAAPEAAPRNSRRQLLIAASAVVTAGVAGAIFVPTLLDAHAYETGYGERTSISLPDGSTSELGAGSRMELRFTEAERRIRLIRGEAYFDVAHDPARPFLVDTPFGTARVHGTAFVVRIGADGARTTVLRGVVEGLPIDHSTSVMARANDEISFGAGSPTSATLAPQVLERRLAWRDGMLAFDGETLRDAALEVERQTGIGTVFADPSIAETRIGGYISATDIDAFVTLLEQNLELRVARRDRKLVLSYSS